VTKDRGRSSEAARCLPDKLLLENCGLERTVREPRNLQRIGVQLPLNRSSRRGQIRTPYVKRSSDRAVQLIDPVFIKEPGPGRIDIGLAESDE
jgi:hypothetical protein